MNKCIKSFGKPQLIMELYFEVMTIIFFGFCKSSEEKKICQNDGILNICCSDFHMEDGQCVACPVGSFGVNCSKSCPKGHFGEFCVNLCNCTRNQICNLIYGCVDTSTDDESEMTKPLFKTDLSASTLQTTESTIDRSTDLQNTVSKPKLSAHPFFVYFVSAGLASLCCITCLLATYKSIRHGRNGIYENSNATVASLRQEEPSRPEASNVDYELPQHEYIEIIDVESTYLEPCSVTTEDEK